MTTPRTWFITGTSSGFGRELTELLLTQGERVAATSRKIDGLNELKAQYGDLLWVRSMDVTDTAAVRQVVDEAFEELGRIDVVVNNAGYALFGAAEEVTDEQIVQQINTNLIGSISVIRAALPHLRAQGGGRIMQVSSEGGSITYPSFSLYHATKWGIEGFIETLAQEVAPLGIECTILEPGPFRTAFGANLILPAAIDAYENTPVGDVRRAVEANAFPIPGDPRKMAQAIIHAAEMSPAPRRLVMGSGAYERIHQMLTDRLTALEAQKEIADSTEADN